MRIITYNVNGIRAAVKKGFAEWLQTSPADIICLQEIKADKQDIPEEVIKNAGYDVYSFSAQKKGYSGVAILSKLKFNNVIIGNNHAQSDTEGRVIAADMGNCYLINAYFPSGTSGEDRQTYKYQWLDEFFNYVNELKQKQPNIIVCGDYNICHKAIDIHDPVRNKNYTGFLPEERAWMDKWFDNGMTDSFRQFNQQPHQYTWWSQLGKARETNKGWRIDYISVSEPLRSLLTDSAIMPDVKHSDHCPMMTAINL
ncbi:MAG: exodeoxyribonuclease III [Chitinophagia bacterium]|nr:exodeoxyribonuclease III [Chitinophagia bacterium]